MSNISSKITVNDPIYSRYFPESGEAPSNWEPFKKTGEDENFLPDLTVKTQIPRQERAKQITILVLKIILFPWGLYEVIKGLMERIVLLLGYPAQLFSSSDMRAAREAIHQSLSRDKNREFIARRVVLEKDGCRYFGLLFGRQSTISNGKWSLLAVGNGTTIEHSVMKDCTKPYFDAGFNMLLVNGPGVSPDKGLATVKKMGDAQDVGVTFLETAVRAKKILLAGHSMGAAAIGLAVLKHRFNSQIEYLAMRMMTFDRFSHIVTKLAGALAGKIAAWASEMDSVKASRKLQEEGIHEIVIQGQSDDLMTEVSLLEALQKENLMANKTGINVPGAGHNALPHERMTEKILTWDQHTSAAIAV